MPIQILKNRRVDSGILPCLYYKSEKVVFMATNVISDMLRQNESPTKSRRKSFAQRSVAILKESVQLGCRNSIDISTPLLKTAVVIWVGLSTKRVSWLLQLSDLNNSDWSSARALSKTSAEFSSVFTLFDEMRPIFTSCWNHNVCISKCFALRPHPNRCMMNLALLSVQTTMFNGLAVCNSNRCSTYYVSLQPFLIAFASDSAEDVDTVAYVTDQWRTMIHVVGPIANKPPLAEHSVFGSPAQSASTITWMTSSSWVTQ